MVDSFWAILTFRSDRNHGVDARPSLAHVTDATQLFGVREMNLRDYVNRMLDLVERQRVLQAMDEAENTLIATEIIDDIEVRYGDGAGLIDVESCIKDELSKRPGRTEFEALMRAAAALQIRMAFKKLDTADGPRYVRLDKLQ